MNEREFAKIVAETKGIVLSAIEKHLDFRFSHAIDDVVQETYLRAYKSLVKGAFREESALSSWLFAIARNESRRMNERLLREEKKSMMKAEMDDFTGAEKSPAPDSADAHDIAELREAIGRLPEKYGLVMRLAMDGFSTGEIAGALNIRQGTVKSRSSRGREMLQKLMRGGES
jgi:RNA polymerase sigma-70 factor (ECF subfamily)